MNGSEELIAAFREKVAEFRAAGVPDAQVLEFAELVLETVRRAVRGPEEMAAAVADFKIQANATVTYPRTLQ